VLAIAALLATLAAAPVAGELPAEGVTIQYTERAAGAAPAALKLVQAEKAGVQAQLERVLGQKWPRPITVRLGSGREEFEGLAEGGKPQQWAVALAYPEQDTMLLDALQLTGPQGPTTVRHELVHLALGQLGSFPRWFHEGFADLLSGEAFDVEYYAAMYRGVHTDALPSFSKLADEWPPHRDQAVLAYAQSISFASFLADRHGAPAFDELFQRVRQGEPFEIAFAKAFHASIDFEESAWRRTLERRYGTIPLATAISLLWSCTALLCVLAFVRRRSEKEKNLRRMDEEAALEALLLTASEVAPDPPEGEQPPEPPIVH
jgi:peptidase MA superfamily protein